LNNHSPDLAFYRKTALVLTAALAVIIAMLTLMPVTVPDAIPGTDKIYHLISFAALVLPCAIFYPRALLWILPTAILFGGAIEIIQPSVGRHGEWADFYADTLGVVAGAILGLCTHLLLHYTLWRNTQNHGSVSSNKQ
jgi:VanZ family protein